MGPRRGSTDDGEAGSRRRIGEPPAQAEAAARQGAAGATGSGARQVRCGEALEVCGLQGQHGGVHARSLAATARISWPPAGSRRRTRAALGGGGGGGGRVRTRGGEMVRGIGARRVPLQDASGVGRSRAAALGFMCACDGI